MTARRISGREPTSLAFKLPANGLIRGDREERRDFFDGGNGKGDSIPTIPDAGQSFTIVRHGLK